MLIRKIVVTKKSELLRQRQHVYTFLVPPNLNKFQIRQELRSIFPEIKVKKIRTTRYKPVLRPERYSRKKPGKLYTKLQKKAFVELSSDSKPFPIFKEENTKTQKQTTSKEKPSVLGST